MYNILADQNILEVTPIQDDRTYDTMCHYVRGHLSH